MLVLLLSLAAMAGHYYARQSRQQQPLAFTSADTITKIESAVEPAAETDPTPEPMVFIDLEESAPSPAADVQVLIDINRAPWAELTLLPGIGETLARRIIASRESEGRFQSIEDLARVHGIGPKTVEKIRPFIRPVLHLLDS